MLIKAFTLRPYNITSNNGKDFDCHEEVANNLRPAIHFAYPYASGESGTNENINGLIRQ